MCPDLPIEPNNRKPHRERCWIPPGCTVPLPASKPFRKAFLQWSEDHHELQSRTKAWLQKKEAFSLFLVPKFVSDNPLTVVSHLPALASEVRKGRWRVLIQKTKSVLLRLYGSGPEDSVSHSLNVISFVLTQLGPRVTETGLKKPDRLGYALQELLKPYVSNLFDQSIRDTVSGETQKVLEDRLLILMRERPDLRPAGTWLSIHHRDLVSQRQKSGALLDRFSMTRSLLRLLESSGAIDLEFLQDGGTAAATLETELGSLVLSRITPPHYPLWAEPRAALSQFFSTQGPFLIGPELSILGWPERLALLEEIVREAAAKGVRDILLTGELSDRKLGRVSVLESTRQFAHTIPELSVGLQEYFSRPRSTPQPLSTFLGIRAGLLTAPVKRDLLVLERLDALSRRSGVRVSLSSGQTRDPSLQKYLIIGSPRADECDNISPQILLLKTIEREPVFGASLWTITRCAARRAIQHFGTGTHGFCAIPYDAVLETLSDPAMAGIFERRFAGLNRAGKKSRGGEDEYRLPHGSAAEIAKAISDDLRVSLYLGVDASAPRLVLVTNAKGPNDGRDDSEDSSADSPAPLAGLSMR